MKCAGIAVLCAVLALQFACVGSSPVEKVVQLLRDLKTKITEDGATEQAVYDRFACWCEKTTDRKAKAITEAQDELRHLGQSILELKGAVATLMAEIEQLTKDIKANEEEQQTLTSIRQKENAEFMAESGEMKEVLAALGKAIEVLRDGTTFSSFLQQGSAAPGAIRRVIEALPTGVAVAAVKPEQLSLLRAFAVAHGGVKYAPQSLTIQGILADMFTTFSADLETSTETEGTKNRQFEDLIATKQAQLLEMQKDLREKGQKKAEAETQLAEAVQSYDDTAAQMKADVAFFDQTKESCQAKHSEWVTRKQLRAEELEGISKAIEILSSDDARELFGKAIKPGKETHVDNSYDPGVNMTLLQISSEGSAAAAPAGHAYAALKASATRARSLRLAALAAKLRLAKVGHFDEVITAIDAMIQTLKQEGVEDIKKRDQCLEEYQKINSTVANLNWLIKNNELTIDKLEQVIGELTLEKEATIQAITDVKQEIIDMKAERTAENEAFKQAKKDDQDAIALLSEARDFLSSYYANHSIELGPLQLLLAQTGPEFAVSPDQAPDANFSSKGLRKVESKGILQLMTMIMEDLRDEIRNGMKEEERAQLAFEKQLKAAEDLQAELEDKKVSLEGMIANREQLKTDEETKLNDNEADRGAEEEYRAKIQPDCDWILRAFTTRATRRTAEMDGLVGAKEYLAGYSPPEETVLLERTPAHPFDDSAFPSIRFLGLPR